MSQAGWIILFFNKISKEIISLEIQPCNCFSGCDRFAGRHHHPHQHAHDRQVQRGRGEGPDLEFFISRWTFGSEMCDVMTSLEVVLLCGSINLFVLVNLDRLLSLKFPLSYNNKSPTSFKIIKIGIAISCLAAFLPALPMWIPEVHNTKGNSTDGSGNVCAFPYKSVSLNIFTSYVISQQHNVKKYLRKFGSGLHPP